MGSLVKKNKKSSSHSKTEAHKEVDLRKSSSKASLHLLEVPDEELRRLRIDVYPYLI